MPIRRLVNWLRGKTPADAVASADGPLIIVITPEAEVPGEIATVKKLFAAGLTKFHLRRHDWGAQDYRDWILEIPKKYRSRLVLHGHPELVAEYGLGGLHLASERGPHRGKRGKGGRDLPDVTLSRSCHDYSELVHGPKHCAYALLGPVFPSVSKRGYGPRRTPEEYAAIIDYWNTENKGHPVVALGGVTPENIGSVRRMGFAGVAVVGSVWESDNPVAAFRALRDGWGK